MWGLILHITFLHYGRACPKSGPVLSIPRIYGKACPKSGPVTSIWKGLSQKRACPKYHEGPIG